MKITLAQIQSKKGAIEENIAHHVRCIEQSKNTDLILFPELSITNYEPELADNLAFKVDDPLLNVFQSLSTAQNQIIGISLPIKTAGLPRIGLLFFHPTKEPVLYEKQFLHADEWPFFSSGENQVYLHEEHLIAPAICYEVSVAAHAEEVFKNKVSVYMASVAKTVTGIATAHENLQHISSNQECWCMLVNAVGPADNFINAGRSAVWHKGSKIIDGDQYFEQLIVVDTVSFNTTVMNIPS